MSLINTQLEKLAQINKQNPTLAYRTNIYHIINPENIRITKAIGHHDSRLARISRFWCWQYHCKAKRSVIDQKQLWMACPLTYLTASSASLCVLAPGKTEKEPINYKHKRLKKLHWIGLICCVIFKVQTVDPNHSTMISI